MSFVSYSQNFEDLMLWRALKNVENGTYVDVGAQDPVADSVSKAFYEQGWRGTHIEPVPFYVERLRLDRPDETVLQVALGETEGTLLLNVVAETGLSTAIDSYAQGYLDQGFTTQQIHVPMLTLKSALRSLEGRAVHWLKIDVEGFEEQVLKGWDSTLLRPWIMVVEATIPGSSQTDYEGWDPIVQAAGYHFAYFDGLNRFYVAHEHPELVAAFATPPNVFDDVQLSGYSSWGLYRLAQERQQALLATAEATLTSLRDDLLAAQIASEQHLRVVTVERDLLLKSGAEAEQRAESMHQQLALAKTQMHEQFEQLTAARDRLHEQFAETHVSRDLFQHLVAECARIREFYEASTMSREKFSHIVSEHAALHAQHQLTHGELVALRAQMAQVEQENKGANDLMAELRFRTHEWWSVADRLSHELQAIHASTSWRLTAPLRRLRDMAARASALPQRGVDWAGRKCRIVVRPLLVWTLRMVLASPTLRNAARHLLQRRPSLKEYLQQFAGRAGLLQLSGAVTTPMLVPSALAERAGADAVTLRDDLAPRVARLYSHLKKQSNREDY
ncbi:MAG: FkbM family methyltransferase [Pseudomonadota bacterium]|nr:FkbM family methyltransferase [Pseudomonadota bacterium]